MHGRRNHRHDAGKRIRKNWISLGIICVTLYILYRNLFISPKNEDEAPVELQKIRKDFNRQMNAFKAADAKYRLNHKAKLQNTVSFDDIRQQKDKVADKDESQSLKYNTNRSSENVKEVIEKEVNKKDPTKKKVENGTVPEIVHMGNSTVNNSIHRPLKKHRNNNKFQTSNQTQVPVQTELLSMLNMKKTAAQNKNTSNVIAFFKDDSIEVTAECVKLDVRGGTSLDKTSARICIHNVTEDRFVSGILKSSGTWEQGDLDGMGSILRAHPEMTLIDVGCNIGVYSLYAATLGNRVISIDPYFKHLKLLNKSLKLNKLQQNVSILWNAVSKKRRRVNLSQTQSQNLGSVNIRIDNPQRNASDYWVQTIILDDLVDQFKLDKTNVFIKMDIEGSEYDTLIGGVELFRRVNICYVLMEFVSYKMNEKGEEILKFMRLFDLYPYADLRLKDRLDLTEVPMKNYPLNAVFAKNTSVCASNPISRNIVQSVLN